MAPSLQLRSRVAFVCSRVPLDHPYKEQRQTWPHVEQHRTHRHLSRHRKHGFHSLEEGAALLCAWGMLVWFLSQPVGSSGFWELTRKHVNMIFFFLVIFWVTEFQLNPFEWQWFLSCLPTWQTPGLLSPVSTGISRNNVSRWGSLSKWTFVKGTQRLWTPEEPRNTTYKWLPASMCSLPHPCALGLHF